MTTQSISSATEDVQGRPPERFRVLAAGYDSQLIGILWERVAARSGFAMSHLLHPSIDRRRMKALGYGANCYCLRDDARTPLPSADRDYLASLEQPGVPTVHSMIMGDEIVRRLPYAEALAYASFLAKRMEELFCQIQPTLIVSGFDALHSSMALAVARKLGIPWFAISHSTIPTGLITFCGSTNTADGFAFPRKTPEELREWAEQILSEFSRRRLAAPAYVWENNLVVILRRFPRRFSQFLLAIGKKFTFQFDRFTRPSLVQSARDYIRRKRNLLSLPTKHLVTVPPNAPYAFIGLHKEPEMALDVWAPFYSDQFNVISAIARSLPPTHELLVKLHKLDADNYSRRELQRFLGLPNVRLVSPFASSVAFIERAALVFCVQGTITQEAAMAGKPVIVFGDTVYEVFPAVSKVHALPDLPRLVRSKLSSEPPSREATLQGLTRYLERAAPGCHNNWEIAPSDQEIAQVAEQFEALRQFLTRSVERS